MFQCIYEGFCDAGSVVFFVFISYASIGIMIGSGAFNGLVAFLLRIFKGKARTAIIPIFLVVIGAASSTIGLFEEWFRSSRCLWASPLPWALTALWASASWLWAPAWATPARR